MIFGSQPSLEEGGYFRSRPCQHTNIVRVYECGAELACLSPLWNAPRARPNLSKGLRDFTNLLMSFGRANLRRTTA
jgi:hypothetical protein